MVSKSLIQFSVDGWGCVPSLLFDLRPNYGEGNEDNGDLLQKAPCRHCCTACPWPRSRPPLTHTSTREGAFLQLTLMKQKALGEVTGTWQESPGGVRAVVCGAAIIVRHSGARRSGLA